jgi:hypothetical protein
MKDVIRHKLMAGLVLVGCAASLLGTGCGNPCKELAEGTCQISGSDSEACKKVRDMAASVSPEEREACDTALGLVKSLERTR